MSALAPRGHVYAFEPSSRNMGFLRENLAANQVPNVTAVPKALWDRECEVKLFYVEELAGCAFIEAESDGREALDRVKSVVTQSWMNEILLHYQHEAVHCQRLDNFVSEAGMQRLDWIKLDAEGAETAVLTGALDTIARHQPQLITEFNPACMIQYFNQEPRGYFDLLSRLFSDISLIEETAALTAVPDYPWLAERMEKEKGWADLFCWHGQRPTG